MFFSCSTSTTNKKPLNYFTVAGFSLHTQMPKDSVLLLLGEPAMMDSKSQDGIFMEKIMYMVPKSPDSVDRIIKVNNMFKAGLLELSDYRQVVESLYDRLWLNFEDGLLVGYCKE